MAKMLWRLPLLFMLVMLSGCVPEDVVWLPDSSGFFFIRGNSLSLYDVRRQVTRVIVTEPWIIEGRDDQRPALSPEGKRLALVRHNVTETAADVTLLIYDVNARIIHRSSVTAVPHRESFRARPCVHLAWAEWSPDGQHIVFEVDRDGNELLQTERTLGFYDLETKSFQWCADLVRLGEPSSYISDSKGFLARPKDSQANKQWYEGLVFVEWGGWRREFAVADEVKQQKRAMELGVFQTGGWKDNIFRIADGSGWTLIDPARRSITHVSDPEIVRLAALANSERATVCDVGNGMLLLERHIGRSDDNKDEAGSKPLVPPTKPAGPSQIGRSDDNKTETQLEIFIPKEGKRKILISGKDVMVDPPSISGNKRFVVLRYGTKDKMNMAVIDANGDIVATWPMSVK